MIWLMAIKIGLAGIERCNRLDYEGKLSILTCTLARRGLLFAIAIALSLSVVDNVRAEDRHIELYSVNTKENISITYKRDGKYIDSALKKLNHFMRDWRRDVETKMDPELFDIIWEIHRELGSKKPVHLISGYRSPKTNALLRKTKGGQAKKSRHMTGQASDIHFPDIPVKDLRNSALIRQQGGVGYYPTSAIPFVHVDTGGVRHWPRLPRRELALLFPDGKSKHVPSDGKPLTKKDFGIALAALQKRGGTLPVALQRRFAGKTGGDTVVASLAEPLNVPLPEPSPVVQKDKPAVVLASLSPFDGLASALPERKPQPAKPVVQASLSPEPEKDALGLFNDSGLQQGGPDRPSANVPQDQIASAPDYDDDHPDELNYHPVRIMPFLTDAPVAEMNMTTDGGVITLPNVHILFDESEQMLVSQFEPGLQYAKLYWAQQFRGTAVNTRLKRLVRNTQPSESAPVVAAAEPKRTRTAQK
jgi:uncharacterized protein YcbK (DUF882 family)